MLGGLSIWTIEGRRPHNLLTIQKPACPHFLRNTFHFLPISFRREATRRRLQIPSKNGHTTRRESLPQGGKFSAEIWWPLQSILRPGHSNERTVESTGHTADDTPSATGALERRVHVHPSMMFHPFPSIKFRGDLVRHMWRAGKDRQLRNLLPTSIHPTSIHPKWRKVANSSNIDSSICKGN